VKTLYVGLVFIVCLAAHVYALARLMPYSKNLAHDSSSVRRFARFVSLPAIDYWTDENYTPLGRRYLIWVRLTALIAAGALVATILSIAVNEMRS